MGGGPNATLHGRTCARHKTSTDDGDCSWCGAPMAYLMESGVKLVVGVEEEDVDVPLAPNRKYTLGERSPVFLLAFLLSHS